MNRSKYIIALWIIISGCSQTEKELTPAVMAQIEEKVAAQVRFIQTECREEIIGAAEAKVDSILLLQTFTEKIDLFKVPEKPLKPHYVEIPEILDTTPIKPILKAKDSTTILDTIK